MNDFKDKIVLITGGTSGIGEIMTRLFLAKYAKVIIWGHSMENLKNTVYAMADLGTIEGMLVDVSKPEQIANAAKEVLENYGGIDILINNAGIVVGKYFKNHTPEDIQNITAVNSTAPMLITNAFLKDMLVKNNGHICNIASSGGLLGNPKMAVYAASKWSLIGWSESLRIELLQLKKNIHVTTIMPYYIATGMFKGVQSKLPVLDPEVCARTIVKAIAKKKRMVSIPGYIYRVTRLAQALLPINLFDWFTGKVLGIYSTMEHFTGRDKKQ